MLKHFLIHGLLLLSLLVAGVCSAATANPPSGAPGYIPMVLPFKNFTSTRNGVASWKAPTGYSIKAVSVSVRDVGGTTPTMKVRGKNGAYVSYSTTVTAAGSKDATLAASPTISDEVLQSIDIVTGGTSPVFSDVTLFLFLRQN